MIWQKSNRADPKARDVADRHYNRQKPGTPQFVPPGRCLVLYAENEKGKALWVTSWPFAEYVKHAWPGAWVCSAFRNEGAGIASNMIREAVAATRAFFGDPPALGMITFIDTKKLSQQWCTVCLLGGVLGSLRASSPLEKQRAVYWHSNFCRGICRLQRR